MNTLTVVYFRPVIAKYVSIYTLNKNEKIYKVHKSTKEKNNEGSDNHILGQDV